MHEIALKNVQDFLRYEIRCCCEINMINIYYL
nr:MAG TPA: PqqA family [Bacteriophage sp.]